MAIIDPIDLPGKRIRYRTGYDGHETKEILRASRGLSEDEQRFVVVIPEDYPGVLPDVYVNRAILALVQRAMNESGLHVICEQIYAPETDMPEERPGTLVDSEDYLLTDSAGMRVGRLEVWSYCVGGGGLFYQDGLVVDMIIPRAICDRLKQSLESIARAHGVEAEDCGCGAERARLLPKRSLFGRFFGRLVDW